MKNIAVGGFTMMMNDFYFCNEMPAVDAYSTNDSYVLEMDLPGRSEKEIDVVLKERVLTIASRTEDKDAENKDEAKEVKWLICERKSNNFKRSFELPQDIDSEKITASFKNGVLKVEIGKKEASKPLHIQINAA